MITIAGQWGNAATPTPGATPQPPGVLSLPVTASNTAGDWLFAVCAWRQYTAGQGVTVSVGDDAHNRWEPLGAPAADSAAAGVTRTSIWYAPAARVGNTQLGTTTVLCAPNGPVAALAMLVLDASGLLPWDEVAFVPVTAYALAATSLGLTSPIPLGGAQAFALTAVATDLSTPTVSFAGTGWTALTGTSCANGTDHTGDLELAAQWKATTAAEAVTWSSTAAVDLAGIIGAVIVAPRAPTAANPNWPIVITEAAPGAGVHTPPSQLSWQSLSHRSLAFSATQGQPYLLGGLQAAQGAQTVDNPDLALTPPGTGTWGGIDSGTPIRVRAILPASATPHYVAFSGYLQQAPTSYDEQLRGAVQATLTDTFAYATSYLPPVLQAELQSEPSLYALWPVNDPAGSVTASNRAPGNSKPLSVVASKYGLGAGPAAAVFGSGSGTLKGDSGSGMWAQTGVPSNGLDGSSLGCADAGYPPLAGGVTVEGWFQVTATTPSSGSFLTLLSAVSPVLKLAWSTTSLAVTGWSSAGSSQTITSTVINPQTAPLFHLAVAVTRTTYAIYVNGALATSGTWTSALLPAFTALWANGALGLATAYGGLYNGTSSYVAVFSQALPAARVAAHYQAGATAFAGDYLHYRLERILGYTGLAGRRVVVPEAPGMPGGFTSPVTTPPQDTTPMASMATLGGTIPSLFTPGTPGFTPSSGTQANQALSGTAASAVPAVMCVARTGDFFTYPRAYASAQPARWVLGDGPGEIPVWGDVVFPYDPGRVVNNVQLTQPDTGTVTIASISEAGSVAQYGLQTYQVTAYLQYDASAAYAAWPTMTDLADWVASSEYAPHMRAQGTVKASHTSAPGAWAFVLGATPGDLVTVNSRPPTSPGAVISVTGRLMQVKPTLAVSATQTEGSLGFVLDIAPESGTLTCDDMARGVLSGANVVGW